MTDDNLRLPNIEPPKLESFRWYWWVLPLVILIWIGFGFWPRGFDWTVDDATDAGQFGDSFGFVNALFSGLAFAGILVALFMQRKELFEQRYQLYFQYQEIRESVDAQKASQRALERQSQYNLISEALSLASYYSNLKQQVHDNHHPQLPNKQMLFQIAAESISNSIHHFLIDSLCELDGFEISEKLKKFIDLKDAYEAIDNKNSIVKRTEHGLENLEPYLLFLQSQTSDNDYLQKFRAEIGELNRKHSHDKPAALLRELDELRVQMAVHISDHIKAQYSGAE